MSLARSIDLNVADLLAAADALTACNVRAIAPVGGGGNNRIFRVEADDGGCYALKTYDSTSADGGHRLDAEYRALSFIWGQGIHRVPRPLAVDPGRACALLDWIDGQAVDVPQMSDVDAALEFLAGLRRLATIPAAMILPEAKEACLSGSEVADQIVYRFERLVEIADGHEGLQGFLAEDFADAFDSFNSVAYRGYRCAGLDFEMPVAPGQCTLSPSDFGFHNALRRSDGDLAFVDFEYFGWDDPAKLVSDFLLHPAMRLSEAHRRHFVTGAQEIFADDPDFVVRLRLLHPLFGLRWCLILLNEFLPERWQRRAFAGIQDRDARQREQLGKSRRMLRQVTENGGAFPHDA
jgi:hypothetical protein